MAVLLIARVLLLPELRRPRGERGASTELEICPEHPVLRQAAAFRDARLVVVPSPFDAARSWQVSAAHSSLVLQCDVYPVQLAAAVEATSDALVC